MMPGVPEPLITHLLQSSAFVGLVWLATTVLRHNHARVRYWLWMAASVKFLVPFSWLVTLGAHVEWRSAPSIARPASTFMVERVLGPAVFDAALPQAVPASSAALAMLVAVWLVGAATACAWWCRQWSLVRASLRAATPLAPHSPGPLARLTVMSSPMAVEPGVVGIWRPVLVVPEGLLDRLTTAQAASLAAHEFSHVRNRDNLTAAVHMVVEAIFWFHPLVWWLERRLIDERERACDEEVLRSGNCPADYAEAILVVCRLSLGARLPCVAGVTGADLRRRIETILGGGTSRPMGRGHRWALAFAAASSIGLPVAAGAVRAVPLVTVGQDSSTPVAFEVASVRPNRSGERAAQIQEPPGRLTATNVWLGLLIGYAYQISDDQLISAPDWIRTERFDVNARFDHDPPTSRFEPGQRQLAVRTLLADRFKLSVRRDKRELPIYALVPARADGRLGPMLKPSATDCSPEAMKARMVDAQTGTPHGMCGARFNTGRIRFGGYPLSLFAKLFSPYDGRTVVDRTGLTGNWDLDLAFMPEQSGPPLQGGETSAVDSDAPALPTAMQEQLGLRLEPTKGLIEVLVVEHVERPTDN